MSVRSSIEESAVGIAKGHDHGEISELHVLRALLTKFGTDGVGVTNKDVDEKLAQLKSAPSAVIAISAEAATVLARVGNEEPAGIIGDLVTKHFGKVATATLSPAKATAESISEEKPDAEVSAETLKALCYHNIRTEEGIVLFGDFVPMSIANDNYMDI